MMAAAPGTCDQGTAGYCAALGMGDSTLPGGWIALARALDGFRRHLPEEQIQ